MLLRQPSKKLYGRDQELQRIREIQQEVADKQEPQFLLVEGDSGTGKSALVHTAFDHGYCFGWGKYEDSASTVQKAPYSAILEALQHALQRIPQGAVLQKSSSSFPCLSSYIPEINQLVARGISESTLPSRNQSEALKKEILELMRYINHPVVIFIDDIQRADILSIDLLSFLFSRGLNMKSTWLWIAAARQSCHLNEMLPPQLRPTFTTIIPLAPLTQKDIKDWLSNILEYNTERSAEHSKEIQSLSEVVYHKTLGNSLFASTFLSMLGSEGFIWYDINELAWKFDLQRINTQTAVSSNVVDFLISKLHCMSKEVRDTLTIASCFGSQFEAQLLIDVVVEIQRELGLDCIESRVQGSINVALKRGILESYSNCQVRKLRFTHDRIHQACYSLVESKNLHTAIGRALNSKLNRITRNGTDNDDETLLLLTTEQLNRGVEVPGSAEDNAHLSLVHLNLRAATLAKKRSAFLVAGHFCRSGLKLLKNKHCAWKKWYNVVLPLEKLKAEMDLIVGDHDGAKKSVDEVLANARSLTDKLDVYLIKMESYGSEGHMEDALELGRNVLKLLGERLPDRASVHHLLGEILLTRRRLRNHSDESLLALPELTCPRKLVALEIYSLMGGYAYAASKPILIMMIGLREMRILLKFGLSKYSADAFATYGTLTGQLGRFEEAFRFGQLSSTLMHRFQAREHDSKTLLAVNFFVHHLRRPIHESIEPLLSAYQLGMEVGDIRNASMSFYAYICCYAICGLPLGPVLDDTNRFRVELGQYGQDLMFKLTSTVYQCMLNLVGRSDNPLRLTGEAMDEGKMLEEAKASDSILLAQSVYLQRAILANYFNDFHLASKMISKVWHGVLTNSGSCNFVAGTAYYVLGLSACCAARVERNHRKHLHRARKCIRRLSQWVKQGEPNVHHMLLILQAEVASLTRQGTEIVKEAYDKAISVASRSGFVHNAALTNERAGTFFLKVKNDREWAESYIGRAYQLFSEWGACAKLEQMKAVYPFIGKSDFQLRRRSTPRFGVSRFDSIHTKRWPSDSTELEQLSESDVPLPNVT